MSSKDVLFSYMMKMVGLPYIYGGDDPMTGFDCSGLVLEFLWSQGIGPREDTTANGIMYRYRPNFIDKPEFGALAFYGGDPTKCTHVGICLNNHLMLEAGGGGSKTLNEHIAAAANAYVRIRPIYQRFDIIGFAMPPWPWLDEGWFSQFRQKPSLPLTR